jgi:hypothetical protein
VRKGAKSKPPGRPANYVRVALILRQRLFSKSVGFNFFCLHDSTDGLMEPPVVYPSTAKVSELVQRQAVVYVTVQRVVEATEFVDASASHS